jgi:hypothetical protein
MLAMNTNSPMPPIEKKIVQTETLIHELARLLLAESTPIRSVWEAANQVCDRYHLRSAA